MLSYPLLETQTGFVLHGFSFSNSLADLEPRAQSEIHTGGRASARQGSTTPRSHAGEALAQDLRNGPLVRSVLLLPL
jgi:hypothetical protein